MIDGARGRSARVEPQAELDETGLVAVPRRMFYLQAILITVVIVLAFALGYLMGVVNRPPAAVPQAAARATAIQFAQAKSVSGIDRMNWLPSAFEGVAKPGPISPAAARRSTSTEVATVRS